VALLLIGLSTYTSLLDPMRSKLGVITHSAYWVTDIPAQLGDWLAERLTSKQDLLDENAALREELLIHKGRAQQMAAISAENMRLQQLMNANEKINERVLIAEIFGVSPDPLAHKVIINRGSEHGVYEGQPLLDADGLMGQVVEVTPYSSHVLLITDSSHAIPVQVNRNGVRAVAEGIGNLYQLELRHVSNTVDIREGDLLVSSGLGQRFPVGYPVAVVETVVHDPGQPFARVTARPMAQLNRSRHVLLVFNHPSRAESVTTARPDLNTK
jgi:rod shape-determining protein MreC